MASLKKRGKTYYARYYVNGRQKSVCLRIPGENDHPFRLNPITCSDGKRSPIPIQSDHRFRRNPITCFGAIRSLLRGLNDAG